MAQTQTPLGTIAAYFEDQSDAHKAVNALQDAGFTSAHLGLAHRGTSSTSTSSSASGAAHAVGEKAEGLWDKVKQMFEGGAVEPYADERSQGELANREITSDPADDYSSHSHDIHNSLGELSIPEDRARYMGSCLNTSEGGAVVTVRPEGRDAEVEEILTRYGGDLGQGASSYQYPESASSGTSPELEGSQNIKLLGELLRVHKDRVSRGDVRIRKEVVTETQTIQVPVTREELVIERRPVSGETVANETIGTSGEIRIPLSEERASIEKSTVVNEEVSVGKKPVEQVRNLSGEVRHEELVVEDETPRSVNE